MAKNEQGLKIHMKAKHTENSRIKCWKCDFTCATKSDLEEFEELKRDGFAVKEDIVKKVLNWAD